MYVVRLSYESRAGTTGDAALAAAREFNHAWVGLGMPQMRLMLSPFGAFGAPFVQLDATVDDLTEAEAALTRLRARMDPHEGTTYPAPAVEIWRVVEEPPLGEPAEAQAAAHALQSDPHAPPRTSEATAAGLRAQDVGGA
jgi:hypothetical protein